MSFRRKIAATVILTAAVGAFGLAVPSAALAADGATVASSCSDLKAAYEKEYATAAHYRYQGNHKLADQHQALGDKYYAQWKWQCS